MGFKRKKGDQCDAKLFDPWNKKNGVVIPQVGKIREAQV